MHRTHENDGSASALPIHLAEASARAQESSVEMDGEQPLPVRQFEFDSRRDVLDAGVADQKIDTPEAVGLDLRLVNHIHCDSEGGAAVLHNLMGSDLGGLEPQVGDVYFDLFASERVGDLLADTAATLVMMAILSCECMANLPWSTQKTESLGRSTLMAQIVVHDLTVRQS